MPIINQSQSNPFSSNIKDIILRNDGSQRKLSIIEKSNGYCQFERIEFFESMFDLLPTGVLLVREISDIMTYINSQEFDTIEIQFQDETSSFLSITGMGYVNNAASETEENFIAINFSNHIYKHSQQNSMTNLLKKTKPTVSLISSFVNDFVYNTLYVDLRNTYSLSNDVTLTNNDPTSNYLLYKQLNPMEYRIEGPNDNYVQYLYYLSNNACNSSTLNPNYLFWTAFDNSFNFKYIYRNLNEDEQAIQKAEENQYYFAVYNSDLPEQQLSGSQQSYKKIYNLTATPSQQFLSKNYFYIRKTPKVLNNSATTQAHPYDKLSYQFQDEGEKYDIEVISSDGVIGSPPPGADELMFEGNWGYYDTMSPTDALSSQTNISQEYGTSNSFKNVNFMGLTGNYPYVDNSQMWKNIYDLTPIHPNFPLTGNIPGFQTNLQKVINIRWESYATTNAKLTKIREIEKQNFVMYVLCCVAQEEEAEESFFAAITGYKPEENPYLALGKSNEPLKYLYSWNKINFNATIDPETYDPSYAFRALEEWEYDSVEKSNPDDITTFAVNTNERTNSLNNFGHPYYAPGWYTENLGNPSNEFREVKYRPISHGGYSLITTVTLERKHIVKMFKTPIKKLLLEAGVTDPLVFENYAGKYLYTFSAENVLDGPCAQVQTQPPQE